MSFDPLFPYMGGKSTIAEQVWALLGDVDTYVEPFFGSGAVLFARDPWRGRMETVNDLDHEVANVWRAVQAEPEAMIPYLEWPVIEVELHARHLWLRQTAEDAKARMLTDPDYYDARRAAYWAWGKAAWVGKGWCDPKINLHYSLPALGSSGIGVLRPTISDLLAFLRGIQDRLRRVRVACGDWERICTPGQTWEMEGSVGVFFDPPYITRGEYYASTEDQQTAGEQAVALRVVDWCKAHWHRPNLRIVYCGYEGDLPIPDDWAVIPWKGPRGFRTRTDNTSQTLERLWANPACLHLRQSTLFGADVPAPRKQRR